MPYYIALEKEDHYVIVSEHFEIRSNAQKYAERMGWKNFWIATDEQRQIIESGASVEQEMTQTTIYTSASAIPLAEPDATWMKEEGIPWNKSKRKAKKK